MKKHMVFIYSEMISALLDLDHLIVLIKEGLPITFTTLEENGSRLLHFPLFYALTIYAIMMIIIFVISLGKDAENSKQGK